MDKPEESRTRNRSRSREGYSRRRSASRSNSTNRSSYGDRGGKSRDYNTNNDFKSSSRYNTKDNSNFPQKRFRRDDSRDRNSDQIDYEQQGNKGRSNRSRWDKDEAGSKNIGTNLAATEPAGIFVFVFLFLF